jgi:hypothetical protein
MTMHNFHDDDDSDFTPLAESFLERRKGSPMPVILELLRQVHESQKQLDKKLSQHMTDETDELTQAVAKLMMEAFPESDPLGHRAYHEASIKRAEDQAKFWHEMRVAGAKWLGLGVLTFLAGAAWTAFLNGPHK